MLNLCTMFSTGKYYNYSKNLNYRFNNSSIICSSIDSVLFFRFFRNRPRRREDTGSKILKKVKKR